MRLYLPGDREEGINQMHKGVASGSQGTPEANLSTLCTTDSSSSAETLCLNHFAATANVVDDQRWRIAPPLAQYTPNCKSE